MDRVTCRCGRTVPAGKQHRIGRGHPSLTQAGLLEKARLESALEAELKKLRTEMIPEGTPEEKTVENTNAYNFIVSKRTTDLLKVLPEIMARAEKDAKEAIRRIVRKRTWCPEAV